MQGRTNVSVGGVSQTVTPCANCAQGDKVSMGKWPNHQRNRCLFPPPPSAKKLVVWVTSGILHENLDTRMLFYTSAPLRLVHVNVDLQEILLFLQEKQVLMLQTSNVFPRKHDSPYNALSGLPIPCPFILISRGVNGVGTLSAC